MRCCASLLSASISFTSARCACLWRHQQPGEGHHSTTTHLAHTHFYTHTPLCCHYLGRLVLDSSETTLLAYPIFVPHTPHQLDSLSASAFHPMGHSTPCGLLHHPWWTCTPQASSSLYYQCTHTGLCPLAFYTTTLPTTPPYCPATACLLHFGARGWSSPTRTHYITLPAHNAAFPPLLAYYRRDILGGLVVTW